MVTGSDIAAEARKHVGTPWRHQGRYPGVGLDCLGLCVVTAQALGLEVRDATNYRREANWVEFSKRLAEHGTFMGNTLDAAKLGTVLAIRERGFQTHCGVVGERNGVKTLIHAHCPSGKVVEERLDPWARRIRAVYQLHGVD